MDDEDMMELYNRFIDAYQLFLDNPNHTDEDVDLVTALYSTVLNLIVGHVASDLEMRLLERNLKITQEALDRERSKNSGKTIVH